MDKNLRVIIVGVLMGAAEVVPGVSGGTIAFVSGLYERLVNAIHRLTPMRLLEIRRLGIPALWRFMDMNFLLVLFGSMVASLFLLARGVSYLLEYHPVMLWSFFFGMVLTSVWAVGRKLAPFNLEIVLAMITGASIGLFVSNIAPLEAHASPLTLFIGGCIAICAWILPGISGSYILLILGLYHTVISALKTFDLVTLAYVAAGCVTGLMVFSQLLSFLLSKFRNLTLAVLVGFMLGSLIKIWPWKHTTSYQISPDGGQIPLVQEPVLPATYEYVTAQDPMLVVASVAFVVGCVVIIGLDRFALIATRAADAGENERAVKDEG